MSSYHSVLVSIQTKLLMAAKSVDAGDAKDDVLTHIADALDQLAGLYAVDQGPAA